MLRTAIRQLGRCPQLVILFWLCELSVVALAVAPLEAALAPALDRRPAAREALSGHDARIAELAEDHPALVPLGRRSAGLALAVELIVTSILAGGGLAVLVEEDRRGFGRACLAHARRMVTLGLCALVARAAIFSLLGFTLALLWRHHLHLALALTLSGMAAAWALSSVLFGYARALAVRAERRSIAGCLAGALRTAVRGPGDTAVLSAFTAAFGVALLLGEEAAAWSLSMSAIGLGAGVGLVALLALGRALLVSVILIAAGLIAQKPARGYGRVVPTASSSA